MEEEVERGGLGLLLLLLTFPPPPPPSSPPRFFSLGAGGEGGGGGEGEEDRDEEEGDDGMTDARPLASCVYVVLCVLVGKEGREGGREEERPKGWVGRRGMMRESNRTNRRPGSCEWPCCSYASRPAAAAARGAAAPIPESAWCGCGCEKHEGGRGGRGAERRGGGTGTSKQATRLSSFLACPLVVSTTAATTTTQRPTQTRTGREKETRCFFSSYALAWLLLYMVAALMDGWILPASSFFCLRRHHRQHAARQGQSNSSLALPCSLHASLAPRGAIIERGGLLFLPSL